MITPAQLIRVGSRDILCVGFVGSGFMERMNSMCIVGINMNGVFSVIGGRGRNLLIIRISKRCRRISGKNIFRAWRGSVRSRSLWCLIRRWILKLISWRFMGTLYRKMLGGMLGLWIWLGSNIELHMCMREEGEGVRENKERKGMDVDVEEGGIQMLSPYLRARLSL
jgi:hypothetical protein